MNALGRMVVVIAVSLAMAGVLLALPALTSPADPPALVRIELESPVAVTRMAALDVPVRARLTDAKGVTYLLAVLAPEERRAVQTAGLRATVLDADARDAVYYLLESSDPQLVARVALAFTLLHDDGHQAVGRLRAGTDLAAVDAFGARVQRLSLDPITLALPATGAIPTTVPHDPLVAGLIARITTTTLLSEVGGLSGEWDVSVGGASYRIRTRYTYSVTPVAKATQYVYERLQALGYNVSYHRYTLNSYSLRNVIAEKPGRVAPERIVLLTAHLDSRAVAAPHNPAPGADDNASGCAALLQAAEILAEQDFAFTIRLVFFTGEEQGMYGSYYYARDVAAAKQQIIGVLNLDMIAWDSTGGPDIDLHSQLPATYDDSDRLAALFAAVIHTYDLALTPQIVETGSRFSDHSRFWDQGYAAIMAIEDYYNPAEQPAAPRDWNPYYHSINDRLSTLNGDYLREYARASLATFVHLAEPMRVLSGTVTASDTGAPLPATVTAAGAWGAFTGTTVAGEYALALPGGVYTVTAEAAGYQPGGVSAFAVLTGTGARLDFALEPSSPPPPYRFELQGTGARFGDPDDVVTHTVILANTGALSDTYALELSAAVFTPTLPFTATGWVTPLHSVSLLVRVTLPLSPTQASDVVTLTATSVTSSLHSVAISLRTLLAVERIYLPLVLKMG